MAGERRLDSDLGRLLVTDLTDQDDVGVLAKDGSQAVGKADIRHFVDLALVDVVEHVLDRILDGHDVADLLVELVDRGIERRRLTTAGRTGHDHHSVRRMEHAVILRISALRESELRQGDQRAAPVEQPHNQLFAPNGLDGRHPHVELSTINVHADLAVLRPPPLNDVHTGHDLYPRAEGSPSRTRQVRHVLKHAVDPKADAEVVLLGLDVDV